MTTDDTIRLPVDEVVVDPDRFQFKACDLDGATSELRGISRFDPDCEGVIGVWLDADDSRTYVVNGHHRHELARRTGYPTLRCRYIEAGTAQEARLKGALINIREGRGTAIDGAKVFRNSQLSLRDLEGLGISTVRGTLARDALGLANLHPTLFRSVVIGEMALVRGVLIGRELPDHADQLGLLGVLQNRGHRDLSEQELAEAIRLTKAAPATTTEQATLFGVEMFRQNLVAEKATLSAFVKSALGRDRRILGYVAKRERQDTLSKGGNRINQARSAMIATQASQVQELFERLSIRRGPIADCLNGAAQALAASADPDAIKSALLDQVRQVITGEFLSKPNAETGPGNGNPGPRGPDRTNIGGLPSSSRMALEALQASGQTLRLTGWKKRTGMDTESFRAARDWLLRAGYVRQDGKGKAANFLVG
jgi:hypothetical protein